MKNLKNLTATFTLSAVMVLSAVSANAGILLSDRSSVPQTENPCTEAPTKYNSGILMSDLGGIIIAGFTGIIISGNKDGVPVNCGIILTD